MGIKPTITFTIFWRVKYYFLHLSFPNEASLSVHSSRYLDYAYSYDKSIAPVAISRFAIQRADRKGNMFSALISRASCT